MTSEASPVLLVHGEARFVAAIVGDDAEVLPVIGDPSGYLVDGLERTALSECRCRLELHPAVQSVDLAWSVAVRADPSLASVRHRLRSAVSRSVVVEDPGLGTVEHVLYHSEASALEAARALC